MDRSRLSQVFQNLPAAVPVMTREKFAQHSGLAEGVVQGMIEKGHLPSIKIGRYRLVNVARLSRDCIDEGGNAIAVSPH